MHHHHLTLDTLYNIVVYIHEMLMLLTSLQSNSSLEGWAICQDASGYHEYLRVHISMGYHVMFLPSLFLALPALPALKAN